MEGPDHSEKMPSVMDIQLQRLAAHVRADSALGPLLPDLVAVYRGVLEKLDREPARVTVTDPSTRQPAEIKSASSAFNTSYSATLAIRMTGRCCQD